MPDDTKFPHLNFEVMPHYRGIEVYDGDEATLELNIADAFKLAHELDVQVALASGLELITVRADAVEVDDILWDLGKLSVKEVSLGIDIDLNGDEAEMCRVLMNDAHTEMDLRADIRLRVGRAIV